MAPWRISIARAGTSVGVADLLAQIEKSTGFDPRPLAQDWLRSATPPEAALSPVPVC